MSATALYARVSDDRRQNLAVQLEDLRQHCQGKSWGDVMEYTDDVSSRLPMKHRPGLMRLLEECRRGRVNRVIVVAYDRLARDTRELLELAAFFQGLHVDFISLREGVDTTTPIGQMYFTFLAGFAQFERDRIRERIMAGLRHARRLGIRLGPEQKVNLDEAQVLQLYREGRSRGAIARLFTTAEQRVYPMQVTRVLRRHGVPAGISR